MNNGQPVTKDILYKVLKRAYPDETEVMLDSAS